MWKCKAQVAGIFGDVINALTRECIQLMHLPTYLPKYLKTLLPKYFPTYLFTFKLLSLYLHLVPPHANTYQNIPIFHEITLV